MPSPLDRVRLAPASAPRPGRARASAQALRRLALVLLPALASCLAAPPPERAESRLGSVRAESEERARAVAELIDRLAPEVERALPDLELGEVEVWVQEQPTLYAFQARAYSDADGFWAEGLRRIHLRARADQLERTLVHELVHAGLGESWRTLPGTIEEGLCDLVAARLCPSSAARLRAGRLASAALALGELPLEVELEVAPEARTPGRPSSVSLRVRLLPDPPVSVDPEAVFRVAAGLSSSAVPPGERKAYYGLGFLVAERIERRIGVHGLQELCQSARAAGREHVDPAELRRAAGIGAGRAGWRAALVEALGPAELRELLRQHPDLVPTCVAELLGALAPAHEGPWDALELLPWLTARVRAGDGAGAALEWPELAPHTPRIVEHLARR